MCELTYLIVGADGKVYGPASLETLRRWLAEGRVERRSPVLPLGATAWTTIGALPELAPSAPPPPPPGAGSPPPFGSGAPFQPPFQQVYVKPTHSLATWGLVCGILSYCLCCMCVPVNVLGLIFSLVALIQINEQPDRYEGKGMAIAGLILSGLSILIFLLSLVSDHSHVYFNGPRYY
jgi:hypothetical protein